jgi:hypothetical protein
MVFRQINELMNVGLEGEECYGTAFKVSTTACFIALGISVMLAIHRERKLRR